ncbi:DNA cross-link repair protein SNM1 [Acorus calamus]|uniref:DNA cross-link repair protein SNM1 n=1 Tax=Acorus calamus TaxID=4465 RepID=A0AAV9F2S7_ACOCL|nr:DNA cross-link repair protein SNM1 [Acorus calamus]
MRTGSPGSRSPMRRPSIGQSEMMRRERASHRSSTGAGPTGRADRFEGEEARAGGSLPDVGFKRPSQVNEGSSSRVSSKKMRRSGGGDHSTGPAKKGSVVGNNRPRICPFYKKIPGTSFTVDAFRYGCIDGCLAYFLTHFHGDHYGGLNKGWSHGPIYCTPLTARLVKMCLSVNPQFPSREEVVNFVVKIARNSLENRPKTLIVVGAYSIGKEHVYLSISQELGNLKQYLRTQGQSFTSVLAFRPTGWTFSESIGNQLDRIRPSSNGNVMIYGDGNTYSGDLFLQVFLTASTQVSPNSENLFRKLDAARKEGAHFYHPTPKFVIDREHHHRHFSPSIWWDRTTSITLIPFTRLSPRPMRRMRHV